MNEETQAPATQAPAVQPNPGVQPHPATQDMTDEELQEMMLACIRIKDRVIEEAGWQDEEAEEEQYNRDFRGIIRQWPEDWVKHTLYVNAMTRQAYVTECRYLVPDGGGSGDDVESRDTGITLLSEDDLKLLMG